jgi:chromosome segregation ATPase
MLVQDEIDRSQIPHPFWDQFSSVLSHRESNVGVLHHRSTLYKQKILQDAADSSAKHATRMQEARFALERHRSDIAECKQQIESEKSTRPYDDIRNELASTNSDIDYLTRSIARRRRVVSELKDQLQYHITKLNLDQDSFDTQQRQNRNVSRELTQSINAMERKVKRVSRELADLRSPEAVCHQLVQAVNAK